MSDGAPSARARAPVELVVVGTSWGGLEAVGRLVGELPPDFPAALAVVQHRSPESPEGAMVRYLQERCALPVTEVDDKDGVEPGRVYVGPADYHLLVGDEGFSLSVDPPVANSRPSIDVLFETAAEAYGPAVLAVVLTGANADGSRGAGAVKAQGGRVLAEDPATAERPEMPAAAIDAGVVDEVLALPALARRLVELVGCR